MRHDTVELIAATIFFFCAAVAVLAFAMILPLPGGVSPAFRVLPLAAASALSLYIFAMLFRQWQEHLARRR